LAIYGHYQREKRGVIRIDTVASKLTPLYLKTRKMKLFLSFLLLIYLLPTDSTAQWFLKSSRADLAVFYRKHRIIFQLFHFQRKCSLLVRISGDFSPKINKVNLVIWWA
jgi:hypothetical protein